MIVTSPLESVQKSWGASPQITLFRAGHRLTWWRMPDQPLARSEWRSADCPWVPSPNCR